MTRNTWKTVVFCLSTLSFIPTFSECRALNGYKFSVYTTEFCPRNQKEWQNRSSTLNCKDNSYMCIPNEHLTELLEFCYTKPITNIPPETCLYLYGGNSAVNDYNCSKFAYGCPNSSYVYNEAYQYQSCVSIGKGFFLAERSCNNSSSVRTDTKAKTKKTCKQLDNSPSEKRSIVVWIVVVTLLCVLLTICTIFHWIRKPNIRLSCTLKLNDSDTNSCTQNQNETTPFIAHADQDDKAVKRTDVSSLSQTYAPTDSANKDNRKLSNQDTSETIISADSGICNNIDSPGDLETVKDLLKNGSDVNSSGHDDKSYLYLACESGHVNNVKLLLGSGADVNRCDNDGASPLYIACQQGHKDIVELLLEHGAVIDDKTNKLKCDRSKQ